MRKLLVEGPAAESISLFAEAVGIGTTCNPSAAYSYISHRLTRPPQNWHGHQVTSVHSWPTPLPSGGLLPDIEVLPPRYQGFARSGKETNKEVYEAISQAISLLSHVEANRVLLSAKWLIPIFGIEGIIESSFSSLTLPWVIFLSPKSVSRTLEAIVHESAHHELFLFEIILDAYGKWSLSSRHEFGESFYSPWRNEYRPAISVLHGAYVFSRIGMVLNHLNMKRSVGVGEDEIESDPSRIVSVLPFLEKTFRGSAFAPLVTSIYSSCERQAAA